MGRKFGRKIVSIAAVMSVLTTLVYTEAFAANNNSTTSDSESYYSNDTSDGTFIAVDMDGNVTHTAIEDVEAMDVEELEAIDNVEYEVVLEVEGEEIVVATLATEAEAEAEAEIIQEIIDEQPTAEAVLAEVGVESEAIPVAEPLVIEIQEQESVEEEFLEEEISSGIISNEEIANEEAANEEASSESTLVFSVTSDAASTQTSYNTNIQVSVKAATQEVSYGVVIISGYVEYKNEDGVTVSTHGSYAPDAAYLGTTGSTYIFRQSAASGYISTSSAYVVEYDTFIANGNIVSTYTTSNGNLYHNITTNNKSIASTIMVGYQQDYMSNNATYYSYDGHYFYTSYKTMVTDYKNGTYLNAINATNPYYNYYQFLSQRSTTNFTADQINEYLEYKLGSSSTSVLLGKGSDFISNQNTYGINALLTLGISINESDWGRSSFATERMNVFGHGAYDNDVYNAYTYTSVSASIIYHMESFMSLGYVNPKNWKYNGSNLGDKDVGANVYYASDPYWGEKAASQAYLIEAYFSDDTYDYNAYQIGVTSEVVYAYNELGGTSVYNTYSGNSKVIDNYPVIILDSVTYNDELWYKIQSDGVLTTDRTSVNTTSGAYSFSRDYVYVKASSIALVNDSDYEYVFMLGDVSGDSKISSVDYMMIKAHIMGTTYITGTYLLAADVNKDGSITSVDYMMIKGHIMGTYTIQ